jgi:folate-binding protein YgfZ
MKAAELTFFSITTALVFRVEGRDATRYLNARLSNDIKSLSPGDTCRAAMLTAQGRTQGLFRVLALPDAAYLLVCDGGDKDQVTAALKKFIVADRVTVKDLSTELTAMHVIGDLPETSAYAPLQLATPTRFISHQELYSTRTERGGAGGIDWLAPLPIAKEAIAFLLASGAHELSSAKAELMRLTSGIPGFPQELNEDGLFSESGIKDAISFKKGCYVGQEVIEKVDAVGKLSRKLVHLFFHGEVSPVVGETITYLDAVIGKLTSIAHDSEAKRSFGFGTLKNLSDLTPGSQIECAGIKGELLT